ncbi:hypothetical protein BD310DRAFT_1000152, partial [Dichomitus squalens]
MPRRKKAYLAAAAARALAGCMKAREAARMDASAPQTDMEPPPQDATAPQSLQELPPDDPSEALHNPIAEDPLPGGGCAEDPGVDDSDEESVEELEGDELLKNLEMVTRSAYDELMRLKSKQQWEKGERELKGVHTGRAARTLYNHQVRVRAKDATDAVIRNSYEAEKFRSVFKRERSSTEEVLPSSPKKRARLAAAAALQASDTVFARTQIPPKMASVARKIWTFSPPEVSKASMLEREDLPAGAREAVARAIADARRESDAVFLAQSSVRQVRDELVGALGGTASFRDVRHTLLASDSRGPGRLQPGEVSVRMEDVLGDDGARLGGESKAERNTKDGREKELGAPLRNPYPGPHRGLDRVELRLGHRGAVERNVSAAERDKGGGDTVQRDKGGGGAVGRGREVRRGAPVHDNASGLQGGMDRVELRLEHHGAVQRGREDGAPVQRDKEAAGRDKEAAGCDKEAAGRDKEAAGRDKEDGGAVERGREDGRRVPLDDGDLEYDGYLSDMSEDVEDLLPEGTREKQDAWYEHEHGAPATPTVPSAPVLPS